MVSFQQLCEAVGEPQPASSQDELRKEVERLRLEVELASRGIVIDEGDVEVDVQLPPDALMRGFTSPEDFTIKETSLNYSDGSSYEGEVLGNLRHGNGTYVRADGSKYSGQWRYDALEGVATAITADGQTYTGEWRAGKAAGHGVATYQNGSRYEGDFHDDGRHGWGKQTFSSGEHYEGEWEHDTIHGKGRWTHGDGSWFEGDWAQGRRVQGRWVSVDGAQEYCGAWDGDRRAGKGVQYIKGVMKYEGEWADDAQHGQGKCIYADGSVYEGGWKQGVRAGRGTYQGPGGKCRYIGQWENDAFHGEGVWTESSGERYVGNFKNGLREGFGRCTFADGTKYEGDWRSGKRSGQGTCAFANGDVYKGEWDKDLRHGYGACLFSDGTRFKGRWEDDGWVQSAADPRRCRIAGKGATRAVAGQLAVFVIQARDEDGNKRLCGGDEFHVQLMLVPEGAVDSSSPSSSFLPKNGRAPPSSTKKGGIQPTFNGEEQEKQSAVVVSMEQESEDTRATSPPVMVTAEVIDNDDGTYEVSYVAVVAGVYELSITVGSGALSEHVADSPYPVRIVPGRAFLKKSSVVDGGPPSSRISLSRLLIGTHAEFEVLAHDEHGNRCAGDANALNQQLPLQICLEGGDGSKTEATVHPTRDGRLICSYTAPTIPGLYRLHIECQGVPLPRTPLSVCLVETLDVDNEQKSDKADQRLNQIDASTGKRNTDEEAKDVFADKKSKGEKAVVGIRDESRLWNAIAAAAYAADGDTGGWDSDEETRTKKERPEDAYLKTHPDVPVVENLEDLWLVSKLQRERKRKDELEKKQHLEELKSRLEGRYGAGTAPSMEEAEAALKEILAEERMTNVTSRPVFDEISDAVEPKNCLLREAEGEGTTSKRSSGFGTCQVKTWGKPEELRKAAATLDELA